MSELFSLESYFLLNAALLVSYLLTKGIFRISFIRRNFLQIQQLKIARITFIVTIAAFFITPYVKNVFWFDQDNSFQLHPWIKQASTVFLQKHDHIKASVDTLQDSFLIFPSIKTLCLFFLILGSVIFLSRFVRDIFSLHKLTKEAYCRHKINNIAILFSNQTKTPFCWSLFSHHIIVPMEWLEKRNFLQLVIRHELQHLRQQDTYWLYWIAIFKISCFWNPFVKQWSHWFEELQEYACDEALVLKKQTSRMVYAECLLDAVSGVEEALPILGLVKLQQTFTLNRRVSMIFNYKNIKPKKAFLVSAYAACFLSATTIGYALNNSSVDLLSVNEVAAIIDQHDAQNIFHLTAHPEVVAELNKIRSSPKARAHFESSLKRMQQLKPAIEPHLAAHRVPRDLLAIPLVESGFQPLEESRSEAKAAGLWQIIPSTAKGLGLTVNAKRDDRMNTELSTKAAVRLLNFDYEQFQDWKLAVLAYEFGEGEVQRLISKSGSKDAWVLAKSSSAPKNMKDFLALFDASVIIMKNPSLLNK